MQGGRVNIVSSDLFFGIGRLIKKQTQPSNYRVAEEKDKFHSFIKLVRHNAYLPLNGFSWSRRLHN